MKYEIEIGVTQLSNPDIIWEHLDNTDEMQFFSLGLQHYEPIWELQKKLHASLVDGKIPNVVLFVEHEPVYTFGKNADKNYLLEEQALGAKVVQIDRGGEVTFHGPGQLVCYPILDLHQFRKSVSWYMRTLENIVIDCLQNLNVKASRKDGLVGVWVEDDKICAMGVRLSKWATMHGFALNIKPDMTYFQRIIPCGIFEFGVTSLQELGVTVLYEKLQLTLIELFMQYLSMDKNEI